MMMRSLPPFATPLASPPNSGLDD